MNNIILTTYLALLIMFLSACSPGGQVENSTNKDDDQQEGLAQEKEESKDKELSDEERLIDENDKLGEDIEFKIGF